MKKKSKQLIKNTLIFGLGSFGSKIISFFLVPYYTNVLSTAEYGTSDLVLTLSSLLVPVFGLTIHDAVLRFGLAKGVKKDDVIKNAILVYGCGVFFAILITPLFRMYHSIAEWRWYLTTLMISQMANNIFGTYAKVLEKNKLFAVSGVIQTLVLAVSNILFLSILKTGVKGFLISNIIAIFVHILIILLFTNPFKALGEGSINRPLLKQMLFYSLPLILNNVSWWILNSSDRAMIEYYCSFSDLGIYSAASKIPALLSVLTSIFFQAWSLSAISEYENEREASYYSNVFEFFSLLMFICGSLVILMSKPIMSIYVNAAYYSGWKCIPFLAVGIVFYSYSLFFGAIYNAEKKNTGVFYTTLIAAIVNILINYLLLKKIGIIAAAISTCISYFTIGVFRMIGSRKFYVFDIELKKFFLISCVLIIQSIFSSLDVYSLPISCICFLAILIIELNTLKKLPKLFISFISKDRLVDN